MESRGRGYSAVALAALGAGAMAMSMLVFWSGQPHGEPYESDVLHYYTANAGRVRLGDVLWIAGVLALIASAALIRPRLRRPTGTTYLVGMAVWGFCMVASAAIAFQLAGAAAAGTVSAGQALSRWSLESSLFGSGSFLLAVPVIAAAIGIDRERRFSVPMTATGVVAASLMALPLLPWNALALLVWIVGMTAFVAHTAHETDEVAYPSFHPAPAAA